MSKPLKDMANTSRNHLLQTVASGVAAVIHASSSVIDDDVNIYREVQDRRLVEKHLTGSGPPVSFLKEVIVAWNGACSYKVRQQVLSMATNQFGFSVLSKFNIRGEEDDLFAVSGGGDDDDDDDFGLGGPVYLQAMDDPDMPRFNPPVTSYLYQKAKKWYNKHGYGCAPVVTKKKYVYRFDEALLMLVYDFLTSSEMLHDVAFGTITRKDDQGKKMVMPKVIRLQANTEIVKQLSAFLAENGFRPPSPSSIYRFLRAMPAANKRAMKGECVVLVVLFIS